MVEPMNASAGCVTNLTAQLVPGTVVTGIEQLRLND